MRIENQKKNYFEHFLVNIVLDFEARFDAGAKCYNVKFVLQTTIVSFSLRIAAVLAQIRDL